MTAVLTGEMVVLRASAAGKADAIRQSGQVLVHAGCVAPSYVEGMLAREAVMSTYIGHGIAIPHGEFDDLRSVYRAGVAVVQLPDGVLWQPGEEVYLVVGLAATGASTEHLAVLTNLLQLLEMPADLARLVHATDPMIIVERLTR